MQPLEHLPGFEFSGCAVRRRNIISFFGTKWDDKDSLEVRPTGIFIYYPDQPQEMKWSYVGIGMTTGIHGTAVFLPEEHWVFVMDDGEVCVIGGGHFAREKRITAKKNAYFTNLRTIANGFAFAVGTARKVFRRDAKNKWTKLDSGLPVNVHGGDIGFNDMDGFGDSEIYAGGGKGDLWVFNGRVWSKVDLPTNAALRRICCGADGLVYILTDQRSVLVGRQDSWRVIEQNVTKKILEQLVWYRDRIYISTTDALFEIVNGAFVPTHLQLPKQESYARLASGDGILVVAGSKQACMYDGNRWSIIL